MVTPGSREPSVAFTVPLIDPVCWAKSGPARATNDRDMRTRSKRADADTIVDLLEPARTDGIADWMGACAPRRRSATGVQAVT